MNSALMLHRHAGPAVAGSYTVGAIAGACTSAAGLLLLNGLVSPLPNAAQSTIAVVVLVLLVLRSTGLLCLDLPHRAYQIPRDTFSDEPHRAAFRFAYELGTGVRTYITTTAPYALAVLLVLALPATLGPAVLAAAAGALGYGLGRSQVVATQSVRSTIAVEPPQAWLRTADIVATTTALLVAITSFS